MSMPAPVSSARELEELSRAGYGPDDFMMHAAEILHRAVPFDGLCMGLTDPATNLLVSSTKFDLGEIGDTDFLYWEYAEPDVAHFRELAGRACGVSVLEQETGGDKNASGRFREVIRPQILPLLTAAYGLSEREARIVQAVLRGETTQTIGHELFLSPHTVQDHFKSIFEKLGVSSRREVAARVFYDQYLDHAPVAATAAR